MHLKEKIKPLILVAPETQSIHKISMRINSQLGSILRNRNTVCKVLDTLVGAADQPEDNNLLENYIAL